VNHARRQQFRRLSRAGRLGLMGLAAAALGLFAVDTGAVLPGALAVVTAAILCLRARHWLSLAGRSRAGARSEDDVRRALARLEEHGWRLRHGLRWSGPGDVDSVAIAPTGVGFAIETKTRRYDERHLARVFAQAIWMGRRRREWCRRGALPVLCVVRSTGVEQDESGVLVVSIDRLVPVLVAAANVAERVELTWLEGLSAS
jgi:nuclease-like protein